MKYSLSPQEIPWASPAEFPSGSGYISSRHIFHISSRHNTDTVATLVVNFLHRTHPLSITLSAKAWCEVFVGYLLCGSYLGAGVWGRECINVSLLVGFILELLVFLPLPVNVPARDNQMEYWWWAGFGGFGFGLG